MIELIEAKNCGNCRHNSKNVYFENHGGVRLSYCNLHKIVVSNQLICKKGDWEPCDQYIRSEMYVPMME